MASLPGKGFFGRKSGRYRVTGASMSSLPSSTRRITPMSVKSFETEPTRYTVSAVAGRFTPGSA